MEFYDETPCCPAPEAAPVDVYEPAPLPAYDPPAPVPPAAEIFPEVPAAPVAPAAVTPMPEAPLPQAVPEPYQPVADAPLTSGTLLGPSVVGGSTDLGGSGFVGGTPDLSGTSFVGGAPEPSGTGFVSGPTDLGITWVDNDGTPVAKPEIPVAPGPFNAAAANIVNANNVAINDTVLGGGGSGSYPAPWTPGYDSDRDGVLNERDRNPRDPFA